MRDENGKWGAWGAEVRLEQDGAVITHTERLGLARYEFAMFHPNNKPYDVVANWTGRTVRRTGLRLASGETLEVNLSFSDQGGVSGTLRMFDQSPHSAVPVELLNPAGEFLATRLSDQFGKYLFDNLAPGEYRLRCQVLGGYEYYAAQAESPFVPVASNRASAAGLGMSRGSPGRIHGPGGFSLPSV